MSCSTPSGSWLRPPATGKHAFQNHIETSVNKPDKTLPHVVTDDRRPIAERVFSARKERRASIPVGYQFLIQNDAHRQVRLETKAARAPSLE